jgi:hypothetical protein
MDDSVVRYVTDRVTMAVILSGSVLFLIHKVDFTSQSFRQDIAY